jgi:hypothetical protein
MRPDDDTEEPTNGPEQVDLKLELEAFRQWFQPKEKKFEEVLIALGKMTTAFNLLENELKYGLARLINGRDFQLALIISTERRRFEQLLDLLKRLWKARTQDENQRTAFDKISNEARQLNEHRNQLVHSIWHIPVRGEADAIRIKDLNDVKLIEVNRSEIEEIADQMNACAGKFLALVDELLLANQATSGSESAVRRTYGK